MAAHEVSLEHADRPRTDAAENGALILVSARDRLVGAHALAPAAGELVHEPAMAIQHKAKLRELSRLVHVYPTLSSSIVPQTPHTPRMFGRGDCRG